MNFEVKTVVDFHKIQTAGAVTLVVGWAIMHFLHIFVL